MHDPEVSFVGTDAASSSADTYQEQAPGETEELAQAIVHLCAKHGMDVCVRTVCGHLYHASCLIQHIFRSATNACAVCRGKLAIAEPIKPLRMLRSGVADSDTDTVDGDSDALCMCRAYNTTFTCDDAACQRGVTLCILVSVLGALGLTQLP